MEKPIGLSERSLNIAAVLILLLVAVASVSRAETEAPFSLADALAYALNHNPRIAAAVSRVSQAEAGLDLARSLARPEVALRASGRLQHPVQEIDIPIPGGQKVRISRPDQASASIGVMWPLWTGGRTSAARGVARAQVAAAEADLQQATEQLLYEVGVAYYQVLIARHGEAEAQAAAVRAEQDVRAASVRRQAGVLTAGQLAEVEASLAGAEQRLATTQNAVLDAEEALNRLLGRELEAPVALVGEPLALEIPDTREESVGVALATRPELLALEHRQEAAEMAISQARAERNPTVSAVGQGGWQTPTEVMQAHSEFIGIEFSWPILEYSGSQAKARRASAQVRELQQTRQDLENLIVTQVTGATRHVADAREAVTSAAQVLEAATETAREVRARHEAGSATRQHLVTAESAVREGQARHGQAEHKLSAALLARARAMGLMRTLVLVSPEEAAAP
jgi:outer membrane protein